MSLPTMKFDTNLRENKCFIRTLSMFMFSLIPMPEGRFNPLIPTLDTYISVWFHPSLYHITLYRNPTPGISPLPHIRQQLLQVHLSPAFFVLVLLLPLTPIIIVGAFVQVYKIA